MKTTEETAEFCGLGPLPATIGIEQSPPSLEQQQS
jgi:hypothetical protein